MIEQDEALSKKTKYKELGSTLVMNGGSNHQQSGESKHHQNGGSKENGKDMVTTNGI